ncbi:large ribosomal subunit protein mL50 [Cherax quadricarinatus]
MAAAITNLSRLQVGNLPSKLLYNAAAALLQHGQQCRSSSSPVDTSDEEENFLPDRRFSFDAESLAARGYLRSQKPYSPARDVQNQVLEICMKLVNSSNFETPLRDSNTKFAVLTQCSKAFGHTVPNSLMHKITNIGALVSFYKTPINTTVPLDMIKNIDLPKNLHVTYKYTRFHPETDTKFGGVSAFTKDSTIVMGLKNKKRYPGYVGRSTWPYQ